MSCLLSDEMFISFSYQLKEKKKKKKAILKSGHGEKKSCILKVICVKSEYFKNQLLEKKHISEINCKNSTNFELAIKVA